MIAIATTLEHSNTSIETIAMGTAEKYQKYQNKNIKTKSVAFACLPRLRYRPEGSQPTAQTQYLNRSSINRMREARRATQRGTRAAERHRKQNNRKAERANAHNAKPNRKRQFTPLRARSWVPLSVQPTTRFHVPCDTMGNGRTQRKVAIEAPRRPYKKNLSHPIDKTTKTANTSQLLSRACASAFHASLSVPQPIPTAVFIP